ncbi:hypothetical protein KUV85_06910 [Nocardioides panacisoli]|uniref:TY-Chap domain-containing protein n=1 Tax=Nocardioides panacisoli TaxID=627624 RepID=UPI001C633E49|nr:hypothetical protein [Nocardioides panacisoli]QYJ05404.1 hypothetical protein KUV85_06910 [Nocardioides panacisoli]
MSSSGPTADWFLRALVWRLQQLAADEFLIIWVDAPPEADVATPFVRLTHAEDRLLIEVSSNTFLDDFCRLTDEDEFALLELGFHPPVGEQQCFWFVGTPAQYAGFAALACCALAEVLDVTDVRTLAYDGGTVPEATTPMLASPVSLLHHAGTLTVWADYDDQGALLITGQDIGGLPGIREYAYVLVIPAAAFPLLRTALDAPSDVDVRTLATAYGPVLAGGGEIAWLDEHGIPYEFTSRIDTGP